MKPLAPLLALLLLPYALALAQVPPTPHPAPFTVEQATQILKDNQNPRQIFPIFEAAASNSTIRKLVSDYLNQPKPLGAYLDANWPGKGENINYDPFGTNPPPPYDELFAIWTANDDPQIFDLLKQMNESSLGLHLPLAFYAKHLQPGSANESRYFDYLHHTMFDLRYLYRMDANHQRVYGGILNTKTGAVKSWLSPEVAANPQNQLSPSFPIVSPTDIPVVLSCDSDKAAAFLDTLIFDDDVFDRGSPWLFQSTMALNPSQQLRYFRYRPNVITLYHKLLLDPKVTGKINVIYDLLLPPDQHRVQSEDGPPMLADASPAAYPELLAFIADAQKMDLPPQAIKVLKDAKATILDLLQKKSLPVPALPHPQFVYPPPMVSTVLSLHPLTSAQAVRILQNPGDPVDLYHAFQVTATDPATRSALLSFLATWKPSTDFFQRLLASVPHPPYSDGPHTEYAEYEINLQFLQNLVASLATSSDPGTFDVFLRLLDSEPLQTSALLEAFAHSVPPGTPMESLFLAYLLKERPDLDETMAAISILYGMDSPAATAALDKFFSTYEFPNVAYAIDGRLLYIRYAPRGIHLYECLLANPHFANKSAIVEGFFRNIYSGDDGGPEGMTLRDANYSVYPKLHAFVAEAEKLPLSPEAQQDLASFKSELNDLESLATQPPVVLGAVEMNYPFPPPPPPSPPPARPPAHPAPVTPASPPN